MFNGIRNKSKDFELIACPHRIYRKQVNYIRKIAQKQGTSEAEALRNIINFHELKFLD